MIKEENTSQSPQYDQGTLLLWQKHYEHYLHSDRAAVDIGIFVLKVVMVVNAGALIALLATFGQFKDVQEVAGSIAASAYPFFFGLVAAILGAMLSYIYQSLNTAKLLNEFSRALPQTRRTAALRVGKTTCQSNSMYCDSLSFGFLCIIWLRHLVTHINHRRYVLASMDCKEAMPFFFNVEMSLDTKPLQKFH